jgi:hypothetical protein
VLVSPGQRSVLRLVGVAQRLRYVIRVGQPLLHLS